MKSKFAAFCFLFALPLASHATDARKVSFLRVSDGSIVRCSTAASCDTDGTGCEDVRCEAEAHELPTAWTALGRKVGKVRPKRRHARAVAPEAYEVERCYCDSTLKMLGASLCCD